MLCKPIFGEDFPACRDSWEQIFELATEEQRVFSHMKDTLGALGKDDRSIAGLIEGLAPPALLADGFFPHGLSLTLPAICGGHGEH